MHPLSAMRRLLTVVLLLGVLSRVTAQTDGRPPWDEVYEELTAAMTDDDDDEASLAAENYERLQQMVDHPLDLNRATREELSQLPFLSEAQVMDFIAYRDRYGPLRSLNELRMVRSMDYAQIALLPYFVYLADSTVVGEPASFPRLDTIARRGRHELLATARIPFYERQGDRNGYLGYRYRHRLRYEFSYGSRLRLGLTASQDAGEPFMANRNRLGYDYYGYYVDLQRLGPVVERFVAGKYRFSVGMGLLTNSSFSPGKLATLQSAGRLTASLRPHTSHTEADYFQGVAATLRLARPLRLMLFASHRSVDATLNSDSASTAATLITSGYHRTPAEMQKKHNTHLTSGGVSLALHTGPYRLGANVVYTHLDRPLEPSRSTLYRRYYPRGSNFTNASVDYAYTHPVVALSGETATDAHGHLATLNRLSLRLWESVSLVAIQRFYSYRYTALHAHAFSEGGRVQNEHGACLGLTCQPLRYVQLTAYADYASFPWARYLVSKPSHAWDFLLQAHYSRRQWSITGRYRGRLRQRDDADRTALIPNDNHRLRLTVAYAARAGWTAKTLAEYDHSAYKQTSRGWLLAEQLSWQLPHARLGLTAACFDTDDYQSRIYLYEQHLQGDFSFPTYYGRGMRLSLTGALTTRRDRLRLSFRLGCTDYFDRSTVGTGLQQVSRSSLTDLDLQLRLRL